MTNPRQNKLLKLVNDDGYCTVEVLAETLDVSTQTIRRDIKKLDDKGLVIRHHGGASSPSSIENVSYEVRKVTGVDEKNVIAAKIATLIPNDSTVFLSIGTTSETIAKHLTNKKNLQVITNSIRVANVLHSKPDIDVLIPSGRVRTKNGGIVGTEAIEFIANFRFDYFIGSGGSIDTDGTILEYDLDEVALLQQVMKASRTTYIAMDASKYIPKGSVELCNVKDVSAFITDKEPGQELMSIIKDNDVKYYICE
jgi:DeoR/GlpR family transcriptional regulator of sugar metabolism